MRAASALIAVAVQLVLLPACSKNKPPSPEPASSATAPDARGALVTAPGVTAPGAPKPGMTWIPSGVLHAGTPVDRYPRIADEELPGTEKVLGGFYIDELPYPNEPGAIPTANVSRDDAAHLCDTKGKRLCTELEWERACKGPDNTMYEYGDAYRSSICGTGVALEVASRRPSGERTNCKSAFGVREMHGGALEWTDSAWERGERTAPSKLGVLKGGSAVAGEIAGRCSNAMGRSSTLKGPVMGFRCCAGPRNDARVEITIRHGGGPLDPVYVAHADPHWGPVEWVWRPARNEEFHIRGECHDDGTGAQACVCRVTRARGEGAGDDPSALDGGATATATDSTDASTAELSQSAPLEIAHVDTGHGLCGILQPTRDTRDLRMIYMDRLGRSRTLKYAYGRIEVSEPR